ncbi:hypothetical protein MCC01951_16640 [Bifidobacteriaceae bacterium MCC01951]|nr:hypothetical protein MCC01951_16640 [Bifidobacteriaceae bacterium MCC01951]
MFVFGFDGRGLQRARIHLGQIVQLHVFDFTWCLGSAASSGNFGALCLRFEWGYGKKKSPAAMQGFSNEVIREEENDPV